MEKKPESRIEILNRVSNTLDNSIVNFRDYKAIYDYNATLNVIYIGMAQYAKQETKPVKEMVERLQSENERMRAEINTLKQRLQRYTTHNKIRG